MENYLRLHVDHSKQKGTIKAMNNFVFNLWCFYSGFSMRQLPEAGVRSLVLASGTLKPLPAFSQELGNALF